MTSVAIVGGGAAGMGAAHSLVKAGLRVSLFEAEPKLGGHCFGVPVPLPTGGVVRIDAGVSDFNKATFVTLHQIISELGLEFYLVCQDASFMTPDREPVWYSRQGRAVFLRPPSDVERFTQEIRRFNQGCVEVLEDASLSDWTARQYLEARGYSAEFRALYFSPRAQGCFPMPDRDPETYMIRSIVAFWRMHGIVGPGPAERMVVRGGMHAYAEAFEKWLRDHQVVLNFATHVLGIARRQDGIRLRAADAAGAHQTFRFDHVVIAVNPNHVIGLLEDATQEERRIYAGFGWQRARLVVHQDDAFMPRDRATWGAYNYIVSDGAAAPEIRPTITFYPNLLARLPAETPDVFVTMNPFREPSPDRVLTNRFFLHPAVGGISDMACERLEAAQGRGGTWFCGSYLREPFVHEQALRCGVDIGLRLAEYVRNRGRPEAAERDERQEEFEEFLERIPLFAGLDTLAFREVQLTAEPFFAPAGKELFKQGDEADGLYLLKEGEVSITRRLPGDSAVELVRRGPGSVVGEMGLMDKGRRSATATALRDCRGYFMSRERFETLRSTRSRAGFMILNRFIVEMARRARSLLVEINDIVRENPELASVRPPSPLAGSPPGHDSALPRADILVRLPFFRTLSAEELRQFVAPLRLRSYPPHHILFQPGDAAQACYIVVRGALGLAVEQGDRYLQIAVLGPGHVTGQISLLENRPHTLMCRTREQSLVLELDRERFFALRKNGGRAAARFFDAVAVSLTVVLRKASGHIARLRPKQHARLAQDQLELNAADHVVPTAAGGDV